MKLRAIKRRTVRFLVDRNAVAGGVEDELRFWNEAAPIGREFGSPDYERLTEEDRLNRVGVFDPELARIFRSRD